MATTGELYREFKSRLAGIYENNEAEQVTVWAFEDVLNYGRIDISLNKDKSLNKEEEKRLSRILEELISGKPIQYIVGYSWFYGMKLKVNPNVLIPRHETEELTAWIIDDLQYAYDKKPVILDVCTGSGCIALALKKRFPQCRVAAVDISEDALDVARENSKTTNLEIEFSRADALRLDLSIKPDVIVSNPPYVSESEKEGMSKRVKDHEPSLALFVKNEDPLIFYREISGWAIKKLPHGGKLFFEINESKSEEVHDLLSNAGFYRIDLKKDLSGKCRMFRAIKA
jgi:release factor glutamine methyltransferase